MTQNFSAKIGFYCLEIMGEYKILQIKGTSSYSSKVF